MSTEPSPNLSRRGLVKLCVVGTATAALPACNTDGDDDGGVQIAALADLLSGDVVEFEYPAGHAAFAVRIGMPGRDGVGPDEDIVAFHRACPHQGCALVEIDTSVARLGPCGCHLSEFDLAGGGVQLTGRASVPLPQVVLEVRGKHVYAVGLRGIPFGEAFTVEQGR
jgi:arsenite oxidase small subunit